MNFRERVLRVTTFTIFALCAASALPGCANTILPPTERPAVHHAVATHSVDVTELASLADDSGTLPAAPGGAAAAVLGDAQALAGNVERNADEIAALRRAITSCVLALFLLGAVIAVLLAAILRVCAATRADAAQRAALAGAAQVARETERALARRTTATAAVTAPPITRRSTAVPRRRAARIPRPSPVLAVAERTAPLISRKPARLRRRAFVKVAAC